ncbi:GH1 family beta-glucosidase [Yoonia sediminilitoris]|uniref:Beta-glucosidase n=1 Tax=Yoonia sediminilitoris TaxID=1286148 RepID=A0A2T6KRR8_9RHOB|nr:GH1 family beta-glucosidase [Yoonia sediminilitoris]PUB19251.1 beta-glucosidase [Yoonia sediminilitoris]RCW99419.1 beta-glucosidase [Yoonia sediminilitoris]
MDFKRADFPEGFTFGAATAAYQIEGHQFGGAGPCHWDTFAAVQGNVIRNEDGAIACDHYHRYAEDLDLLKDGNMDAYRFSTSWARVMPDGRSINPDGLDFYDRLTDAILERGLKPFQTLYHWELPSALADIGGWANRDTVKYFGDFTDVITDRIGDRMHAIATVNEPWCVAFLSHFLGHHAPGLRDLRATARAMHHIMLAHGEAMSRMRAKGMDNCGIVLNFDHTSPAEDTPQAAAAANLQDAINNRWFIEAATKGTYPAEVLAGFGSHMPEGWQDDMAQISQPMDWLGVNYYTRHKMLHDPKTAWPHLKAIDGVLPKTQMGWEIYPDGLHHFLTRLAQDYVGDLPIFVTENGMAWEDTVENGAVYDPERTAFVSDHMLATKRAIADGANVQGFFYWSLLDNYEWAFGYEKRFGMIHVDFETQKRTPKASYHALKAAIAR